MSTQGARGRGTCWGLKTLLPRQDSAAKFGDCRRVHVGDLCLPWLPLPGDGSCAGKHWTRACVLPVPPETWHWLWRRGVPFPPWRTHWWFRPNCAVSALFVTMQRGHRLSARGASTPAPGAGDAPETPAGVVVLWWWCGRQPHCGNKCAPEHRPLQASRYRGRWKQAATPAGSREEGTARLQGLLFQSHVGIIGWQRGHPLNPRD